MSRVQPSISAPAAPRTCAAVESNSPHGAMRAGLEQANTGISSLREAVDQRDLQLVGIGARLVMIDFHELRGAGAPTITLASSSGRMRDGSA